MRYLGEVGTLLCEGDAAVTNVGLKGFRLVGMSDSVLERTVEESQSERSEIVFPADSNALGNLFGGRLMQYTDLVGAMAASRHARALTARFGRQWRLVFG